MMTNSRAYLIGGPLDGQRTIIGTPMPQVILAVPADPPEKVSLHQMPRPMMRIRYVSYRYVRFAPGLAMIDFQLTHPEAIGCDLLYEYEEPPEDALADVVDAMYEADEWYE